MALWEIKIVLLVHFNMQTSLMIEFTLDVYFQSGLGVFIFFYGFMNFLRTGVSFIRILLLPIKNNSLVFTKYQNWDISLVRGVCGRLVKVLDPRSRVGSSIPAVAVVCKKYWACYCISHHPAVMGTWCKI